MSANQSDMVLLVSPQKQSLNELENDDINREQQIQQIEETVTQNKQEEDSLFDFEVHKNLHSLDEVMFHSSSVNKPRSTSINVNLVEGLREHDKNSSEDILRLSKPSTFEGLLELQESVNCFPEGLSSFLLNSQKTGSSLENDKVQEVCDNMEAISKNQQNTISEDNNNSNFLDKRKHKLPMILLPSARTTHHRGHFGNAIMDNSPINEIQSDNSSYRENFTQPQTVHVTTSTRSGYDNVEALQNDEFTLMFQSNCPIKSPTLPRMKKKHIEHPSQQSSLSSPMKDSLDKLKDSAPAAQGLTDSSQSSQKVNNTPPQIQSLAGISQEEILKNEEDPIEEEVLDLKSIERESIPINKDAVQYGLTDIRSVRNYKVNAFRNKLNLQSQQQQFLTNQEGHMNVSGSQKNIPLMSPPVSLMEMQKNQNYNTVETPIGGVGQRTMQRPRLSVPPLMHLGRNVSVQETQNEQKEYNQPIHEEGQNCAEVDGSSSKRKFQRQLLRIKVDPENSYNKREENTETWDEVVSSDQGPTETILEPKARQGSSNFEDQYTIINERPLGEGTSGCVYQCVKKSEKSDDDTIYAVKVMRNVDEEMSKSIFQTFGIQYRLQHESVSRVYEVYYNENSQIVHFVMEYIPFRSLDSLLRDKKRTLKETDSSQIVLKLLKAVCYMEQRGVCHRDLKPENILISEDLTQIKIIDFGISKSFVKSQRVQHITQYFKHKMYTPTGTPSYKAPEILQGAGYTQLIDMWDVGVITYQLICKGKHPFKCATQTEQDQRILSQNYDQTDECWINASSNAKNFVKQLLRLNRYPAFEALKHPWIEQRKIDVSDDDNRNAAKLEKKPTNDTMTISVPVHFQPRLFNTFNIAATNSEQGLRSSISETNNQAQNQVNSSNDFDSPSGNTNAIITSKQNQDESSYQTRESGAPEPIRKSNFGKQNNDTTSQVNLKKKHSIQSFSSTQDVVHVVMRQKLSESREKMMKFFLKANSIIKNLEEEQLKLEQNSLPGKTHKRTHSAEKQSEQPNSSNSQGNLAVPNLGIEDLSLLSSGGLFGSSSKINTPLVHPNSSMSQEDIQRCSNSQSGTPGAGPGMQTSFHMSLFSKEAQNSFLSNKNGFQNQISTNANNNGNNGNNLHQLNSSNTQSEGDRCYTSQQQILQIPDFNSMKFSSLLPRKSSQQQQSQHAHASNNRKSKLIQRRNSSQQTNSMEMSINFTKEVIGELQQTFDNDESLKGEDTPSRKMKIADYEKFLKNNQINNTSSGSIEERTKTRRSQPSLFFPKQPLQGEKNKGKGKGKKALQELMKANIPGAEGFNENDEEKWKLIAENMERSHSQDDDDDDNSSDSSSSSSSSSDSSEDRTQSFDLDKFLIKQPAPGDQRFSNEEEELNALNPQPGQNQQNEQVCQHSEILENNLKESLSNFPQCFNKDHQSQSKPCSIVISDAKNMGKISSGIFQSTPYVNYMNSSKDNFINKSLIELQGQKDDRHQSSAVVMITSSASSKENSQHHHQNHSAELPMQQQNQHTSHIQHSNSLAQIKPHHHHHPHHTKHNKKNHKNTKINPQKNTLNQILPGGGSMQCNIHCKSNNQTMSSNCSSCGLPNSMQLQEQKSQDGGGGNEEKLFRNKLAPIPKRCSNEISFNDSMGDQNLSFIDMNQSKLVQSFYPNSEDQIPINHSVKKNNFLFSMNVSQTSSITAGNISLSNSGNNNTIRSFHAPNSGIVGSGLNSNGHGENAGAAKERGNNNANASKFKQQQSEQNSSGGSNSMLKKGGKMEFDMSVSQQISQGEIPLQMSQKPFLDNSVLNSSYDATPSKHAQQQQQEQQQASNIGNADPDQNNNSQSDNSNNSKNSLPIAVGESKPVSQGSLSSLSSPQKRKPSGSQSGSGEVQNQQPPQSKENSLNSNEEESNKCFENAIKIIEPTHENEKNKRSRSRSPGNASPVGLRQSGYRGTFYHHLNQQTSNYSTIIEESGETRSYLNSSLAASSKQEFDGTTSMGLRFNQTRSLTQISQSILERYESNAQSLSINYNPSIISHQNSMVGHNQTIRSCEDSDFHIEDRQLSNSNDLNNSPFRRQQISSSGKKLSAAGGVNKSKHSGNPLPNSIKGSDPNSKTHSPKIEKPQISQHSFDEFFGTMQKSAFFEEDLQQASTTVPQESHHHNFQNVPLTSIQEKEQELFSQERHYSDTTSLTEQPPLLKHRKSSLKGAHSKDNFFDSIAEILKITPELSSLQPSSTTNNEKTFHVAK